MFKINNDYPYCSESVVGVKGPILKEILSLIEQVATALVKMQTLSSGNNKNNKGTSSKTAKESYCSDSSFGTDGENSDRFLKTAHRMASSPFLEHRIASVSASAVVVADTNGNVDVEERRKENGNEISTADTELELHDSPRAIIRDVNNNIINNPKGLSRSVFQKGSGNEKMSLVTPSLAALNEPFIPTNLFEKAEYLAMESLRRQYWDGFVNSAYWTKLMHFLWYQDRRVQPDDFFIMRVLGRGGFGLVTGTFLKSDKAALGSFF